MARAVGVVDVGVLTDLRLLQSCRETVHGGPDRGQGEVAQVGSQALQARSKCLCNTIIQCPALIPNAVLLGAPAYIGPSHVLPPGLVLTDTDGTTTLGVCCCCEVVGTEGAVAWRIVLEPLDL